MSDVEKSRAFYKDYLGYAEPFDLKNADGSLSLTFIKINDRQYLELFPEREADTDRLNHIGVETDDVEAIRRAMAIDSSLVTCSTWSTSASLTTTRSKKSALATSS